MASAQKTTGTAKQMRLVDMTPEQKGITALRPCVNGGAVMSAYQGALMGEDADLNAMVVGLRGTFGAVRGGDLQVMEQMLVAQATALQTMFASLARRAAIQDRLTHTQAYMGLALKAQNQSRATIATLIELKHPKQATFVRQANIAHGAQQVNNGTTALNGATASRTEESKPEQNKLLEVDHGQPGGR
ncbi:MAG: hypothetical protein ABIR55_00515, partial [Burkholderiaceae bacterium]